MSSFDFYPVPTFSVSFGASPNRQRTINYDAEKYPNSSEKLMCFQEVMDRLEIIGRNTLWTWRKKRGFPEPFHRCPMKWRRIDVDKWENDFNS